MAETLDFFGTFCPKCRVTLTLDAWLTYETVYQLACAHHARAHSGEKMGVGYEHKWNWLSRESHEAVE